ncbi:MAG: PP2C family protein-serine/threonine phosphatase, partial [Flavobacteriales bacterium]
QSVDSYDKVKDGMDISLIQYDLKTKSLKFAGANNPLLIVPKEYSESEKKLQYDKVDKRAIREIRADKQPVGFHSDMRSFTKHEVKVEEGEMLYMFSDGFMDQFGGEKGKKMKSLPFKKLLLSVSNYEMEDQKSYLKDYFKNWKGDYAQLDDICVMGVKVG